MRGLAYLAFRSLLHQGLRSSLIASAVGLSMLLPLVVQHLVERYQVELERRAVDTPLVVGAKGSRYDLVLSSLYFQGRIPEPLRFEELDKVRDSGFAMAVPIHLGPRVAGKRADGRGFPVVGTGLEYYTRRGLELRQGSLPILLGDALLGAEVAAELGVVPGGSVLTQAGNVHVFSGKYPLRMNVVGVLEASGGPDDRAIFVDLPTVWLAEGIGHGHTPADQQDADSRLREDESGIVLNDKVYEFTQVDDQNLDSFHFHGAREDLPLSAVLVWPLDAAGRTKLKGRYIRDDSAQILVPQEVVAELVGFVFQLKLFFDANTAVIATATLFFMAVIVLLCVQVRATERQTLHRIGSPRGAVLRLFAMEITTLVACGMGSAWVLSWALQAWLWSFVGV